MTHHRLPLAVVLLFSVAGLGLGQDFKNPLDGPPLPGTKKLTLSGDIASQIVDDVDWFLLREIALSICSGDFSDWVWKIATTCPYQRYSYVWHGEYEIFEFDLGSTFNYAEMAALIAPRPFMVERGHFDGVGLDEAVAYEFAKVRHLYQARLGIGDRCEIEWFVGPHEIHAQGTFDFLHKHLAWPKPEQTK